MQKMKLSPLPQIEQYLLEKELLSKTREKAVKRKIPVIADCTGYFLSSFCIVTRPESILEIGCGTGYSTYFLLKDLDYDFRYTGIDLNKSRLSEAKEFIKNTIVEKGSFPGHIDFIYGNARKIIPGLKHCFDLVFIDAAKFEYLDYIMLISKKLNTGAVVIADNILYKNMLFNKKISKHDYKTIMGLRGYIEYIDDSRLFENYFLGIGDGIAISKYKGNNRKKAWIQQKRYRNSVSRQEI